MGTLDSVHIRDDRLLSVSLSHYSFTLPHFGISFPVVNDLLKVRIVGLRRATESQAHWIVEQ